MKKIIAAVLVFVVLLAGTGYFFWQARLNGAISFRTEEVANGRLLATIGSTGTVQAQDVIDVGAQVQGRIIFIGKDEHTKSRVVDWGSEVEGPTLDKDGKILKLGTVLAQIDPAIYAAQVASADASLKAAKADKLQKIATLKQTNADFERAKKLLKNGGILQAEYDQFEANFEVAKANLDVSVANIGVAEANLKNTQTNLEYTTVSAPVKGVVIDRRVNVGQTVVASLSAPSLFLIAKDLSKLEVWATVNEVDVSRIRVDQDVTFTVDAFAGQVYKGKVVPQGNLPFRLNATMNQNVVTYTVVVSVDNESGLLRPYMTANLSFIVADKKHVLLVPNAALRYIPAKQQIVPEQRDTYTQLKAKKRPSTETDLTERGVVWVPAEDGMCRYIEVQIGLSDSVKTELLGVIGGGELPEHTSVIVGEIKGASRTGGANPFAPQMFKSAAKKE